MTSIALATCAHHPGFIADDDRPLVDALRRRHVDVHQPQWNDDAVDWNAYDAVVIRTTWDYQEHLDAFIRWLDHAAGASTLLNPREVVQSNIRKTYLRTLHEADVPIVDTTWIDSTKAIADAIDGITGDIIIKPSVGAGASGLLRAPASDLSRIEAHAGTLIGLGDVIIQPFIESVHERGELSVVVIGGEITHAVRKVPAQGDFRVQIEFGGQYTVVEPTPTEAMIARLAVDVLAPAGDIAYARVDMIEPTPGHPVIGEVELIEPELFLPLVPPAAEQFADVILARV